MPKQRQRLSLYIPGSPPGALPESTYTPSSDRRRSLISLPDSLNLGNLNLKPSKAKLQKNWWPGAKSPTARRCADHTTATTTAPHERALGAPRRKTAAPALASPPRRHVSHQWDDPELRRELEMTLPQSATASLSRPGSRNGGPAGAAVPRCAASVPAPSRAPPPPPIPELSAVNYYSEDAAATGLASPPSPIVVDHVSTLRRRAKTPVHHVGQLEAAQRRRSNQGPFQTGNMDGVNRMSSVSTIAREYRELAVYPDEAIAEVPEVDPPYLSGKGMVERPATRDVEIQDGHLLGAAAYLNHRRTQSSASDDGALPGSEVDASCPSLTRSSSTPAETSDDEEKDGEQPAAPASLRLQIGLELLTKELSRALAGDRRRQQGDGGDGASAAGLQVWVMIEAYERLRERLEEEPTEEKEHAREAIDAWIRALYAIHGDIVSQSADESEYED
ncbi:hypothetical protein ISF_07743 [Cordyceps fumosorosea ARSEF 2679]|uniref:Mating-type switching protein swi10 n=1 Tax=Cordyceps fumosorosea (strain ARSEF 2679) TaxID=1081104 RepID=A0A167NK64_CORFA|nr:hypothetical protein ISF_07743 [Cordyceps fumosorosea ARSEF 2679]OAA55638.1 hypothetical protein ISF_07743 [Cordyceps fumosorosea ARSEF 2679]